MWDMLLVTILSLTRPLWILPGVAVAPIACIGALIVMAHARLANGNARVGRLTPAPPPGVEHPISAIPPARTPHDSSRPLPPSAHHSLSPDISDIISAIPHSANIPFPTTFSALLNGPHGRSLLASAFDAPGDALAAPDGESAPENPISPPIWRRVGPLIEEHRATTLALTGEALGEAALIEPAPPIWRDASALRIRVAEMEGAPEAAECETIWERAPQPPIWRMVALSDHTGQEIAFTPARSGQAIQEIPSDLSELASAPPPIWTTTWISGAWPEAHAPPVSEDQAEAGALSAWSEPPIWATRIRQR